MAQQHLIFPCGNIMAILGKGRFHGREERRKGDEKIGFQADVALKYVS